MRYLLYILSLAGLLLTIIPPVLMFRGAITPAVQNSLMLAGFLLWFASAWFWLGKKVKSESDKGN
jgi:high-affinity Fe2+/Pb2+ permease